MTWFQKESNRAWLYRLLVAGSVVAVGYGVLTTEKAGLWLGLAAAALLGNGLAAAKTSTKSADVDPPQKPPLPPRKVAANKPAAKAVKKAAKKRA